MEDRWESPFFHFLKKFGKIVFQLIISNVKGEKYMEEILPNFLKNRASLTPNKEAIVFNKNRLTFQELYEKAYYTAGVLAAEGITKGDYVAFLVKNDLRTVITLLSLHLLGARAVLLNNRLTANELLYQIKDSNSLFLIADDDFQLTAEDVLRNSSSLKVIFKKELDTKPFQKPVVQETVHLNDTCTIMYTSGTTGFPKGVIQTYGNHWWSAVGNVLNAGLTDKDVWLCTVPIFHISGYSILMRSLMYGMKVILHESFDEKRVLTDLVQEKITIMSVVTAMLQRIEKAAKGAFPDYFRYMLLGGGPASIDLISSCMNKGIPVYYSYGMTETSSQIVTLPPEDAARKIGSAGKPLFPAQLKILDEKGKELGANEAGEIVVFGPNVSKGYLNKEPHSVDGWFHTGDIGYKDSEGFLYVLDRRSDLIISGGENIYPAEIESVLSSITGIKEAGVVGMDDRKWGQVPIAFVVCEEGTEIPAAQILEVCKRKLASYKLPKEIRFIEALPRNASKKIVRRTLREWIK